MKQKILIYQTLPRLFGNDVPNNKENGSLEENGVGKLSAFDTKALREINKMGFTHIWYTGLLEHASQTDYTEFDIAPNHPDVVKGIAGSPYAIRDYYDISPDLADNVPNRMTEFEDLIKRTHENGMKVIIDFVPNHVARQYKSDNKPKKTKDLGEGDTIDRAFKADNNFYYLPNQKLELQFDTLQGDTAYVEYPAKVTGNDCFSNKPSKNDWYETIKLNYGVDYYDNNNKLFMPTPNTWEKMRDILLFWTAKGVDGFRCDMAEMVPVEFWGWVIPKIKAKNKSILFIAEVYNPQQYHDYIYHGLFDYLYDKVDLYDTIRDVICGHRPTSDITFCWQRIDGLQDKMLNFLENHDEQRIASDFFAQNPFKAIPGMLVSALMNTNPVMLYFGQELGERGMDKEGFSGCDGRTTIFDYWSIDSISRWHNGGKFGKSRLSTDEQKLRESYLKILDIAVNEPCIANGKFYDLMYVNYENPDFDSTKQYAFLRSHNNEFVLVVANFLSFETNISVNIPDDAFAFMQNDPFKIKSAKDLISGKQYVLKSGWYEQIKLTLKPYSGAVVKFYAQ